MTTRILVTGGNGFIGNAIINSLASKSNFSVVRAVRRNVHAQPNNSKIHTVQITNLSDNIDWAVLLRKIDIVIHCAAAVESPNVKDDDIFYRINVQATTSLAMQAAAAGVKRFIFISSAKVNGEFTEPGEVFSPDDNVSPASAYAVSKYMAELALQEICSKSKMDYVIIRPPLVYGAGAKGYFKRLVKIINLGLPLPFKSFSKNKRSFASIENLCDFVNLCIGAEGSINQIFFVSDGDDKSTAEIIQCLISVVNARDYMFSVPLPMLKLMSNFIGIGAVYNKLSKSLVLNIEKNEMCLGWVPPYNMQSSFAKMMEACIDD